MSKTKVILLFWFALFLCLALGEGDWWESKLTEAIIKHNAYELPARKPPKYIREATLAEIPHPSREFTQLPLIQTFDDYSMVTANVFWREPTYRQFSYDPLHFETGENWHITPEVSGKYYLIVVINYTLEEINALTKNKTTLEIDFK